MSIRDDIRKGSTLVGFFIKLSASLASFRKQLGSKLSRSGSIDIGGAARRGKKEIADVLTKLPVKGADDKSTQVLKFYCDRYLGISYQRDPVSANLKRATAYFSDAQKCIDSLTEEDAIRQELQARLWGNYGNLAFENRELPKALDYYYKSRDLFVELADEEHIGIANFQIGKTLVAQNCRPEDARPSLVAAESIFIQLGWLEGQGNVYEQYALLYDRLQTAFSSERTRNQYLRLATENAKRARAFFERVDNQKRLGAVESLIQRLGALPRASKTRKKTQPNKPRNRTGRKGSVG